MSALKANLLVTPQEIYSTSSTQGTDLGALATSGDGRYFRYCLAGATALVAGKLQQTAAEDTTNQQALTVTNVALGATSVVTTTTVTLAVNLLAGGFMTINSATTGAGFTYKIKGNTAASAAVTTFTLEDPIAVATTGTTIIDVKINPYQNLIVNPATASSAPVGVAVYNVTAAQYGWVQVHGPVACLADGTVVVGTSLSASNGTAGAVEALAGVQAPVALALTGIATTDYGLVTLLID